MAPTINDVTPWLIESWPSEGPTVRSSTISTGAGSAPARNTIRITSYNVCYTKLLRIVLLSCIGVGVLAALNMVGIRESDERL